MEVTKHASDRMQQRAVDNQIIQWLELFGKRVREKHGATIIHFDKKAKKRLSSSLSRAEFARIEKKLDAYLVASDGRVVTVGHRYKRVRTH